MLRDILLCLLQAPTRSSLLEGRWRLLYTSRPGTASPIQQTFVGVDAFTVYQEILSTDSGVRINNIVSFGPTIGQLKVSQRTTCGADAGLALQMHSQGNDAG